MKAEIVLKQGELHYHEPRSGAAPGTLTPPWNHSRAHRLLGHTAMAAGGKSLDMPRREAFLTKGYLWYRKLRLVWTYDISNDYNT